MGPVSRRMTRSTTTSKAFHVLWIRAEVGRQAFYASDQALAVECRVERFVLVARVCLSVSPPLSKGLVDKVAKKFPGIPSGLGSEGFEFLLVLRIQVLRVKSSVHGDHSYLP